jgi:repressor LexA
LTYQQLLIYSGHVDILTEKQQQVLSYIQKTVADAGHPPTIREIASHLSVTVRSAHQHVTALDRKGFIKRSTGHRRIAFQPQGLPVLGKIAAGTPILAQENIERRIALDDILPSKNAEKFFLLQVSGDSMIEKGINPGDLVLIRHQPTVESGEIAAVLIDDEATLKVFRVKERKIYLEPANRKYKPIYVNSFKETRILGKALMALRFLEKGRTL